MVCYVETVYKGEEVASSFLLAMTVKVNSQQSTVNRQQSTVNSQQSTVNRQPTKHSTVNKLVHQLTSV